MKKRTKILLIVIIAAAIAVAGIAAFLLIGRGEEQEKANTSANVVPWDVEIQDEPKQEDEILIPGYDSMIMKANTKEQQVDMGNPSDNKCYFVIVLKLTDGTELYRSDYLKPGEGLEEITMEKELDVGEYQAIIEYNCYALEDKSTLNSGSVEFTLKVR